MLSEGESQYRFAHDLVKPNDVSFTCIDTKELKDIPDLSPLNQRLACSWVVDLTEMSDNLRLFL